MVEIDSATRSDESTNVKKNVQASSNVNETPDLELELILQVRNLVRVEFDQNSAKYSHRHYEELMDESSPHVCWRYIIHGGRKVSNSVELIKSSLIWRKKNDDDKFYNNSLDLAKDLWHVAPIVECGPDNDGNDVVYIIGKNQRKADAILKPVIRNFMKKIMFDWDQKHKNDMERMCLVFDATDTGYRNVDLELVSWLISLRDYLPARFAKIYLIGIPSIIRAPIRLMINLLSENFRKIFFCGTFEELISPNIPLDRLPIEVGGKGGDSNRLAPIDLPWASETKTFSDPAMIKAIDDYVGFAVDNERLEKLRQLQLEHEKKISNK